MAFDGRHTPNEGNSSRRYYEWATDFEIHNVFTEISKDIY